MAGAAVDDIADISAPDETHRNGMNNNDNDNTTVPLTTELEGNDVDMEDDLDGVKVDDVFAGGFDDDYYGG